MKAIRPIFQYIILGIFLTAGINVFAQDSLTILPVENDSLSKKEIRHFNKLVKYQNSGPFFNHDITPGRKAALYSFGFPGLGQIYNRKYWKLPIVYGVIGSGLYFTATNGKELKRYNTALELRLGDGGDEFEGLLSNTQLTAARNVYRKNTELSSMLTGIFYGLNIIDAVVDAHLFEFDISDDLSFRWHPNFLTGNNRPIPAIHLSLQFN